MYVVSGVWVGDGMCVGWGVLCVGKCMLGSCMHPCMHMERPEVDISSLPLLFSIFSF